MTTIPTIPTGRYRHDKGNEYSVLGVARRSEPQEELVVYRQEYGDRGDWVPHRSRIGNVAVTARRRAALEN